MNESNKIQWKRLPAEGAAIVASILLAFADGLLNEAVIAVEVFEPSTAALDTSIATGMLGSIDDPAPRISLAAFKGLAQDLGERVDPDLVQTDVQMSNLLTMRQAEEIDAIVSARRLEDHLLKLLLELES